IENNFTKIMKYSKNNGGDFSARARNEQLTNLKNKISNFDKEELLVGKGTGAYFSSQLKYLNKNFFMEITEEGHTLYYSTIHDRGILGYLILMSIFGSFGYMIYRQRKSRVIMSFAYLYLLQLIHWKITANTWLYYFWITTALIMSQYEIKYMKKIRRKRNERVS
uniref:hypothetical protein n=1 Tax=Cetobacterium sp. TaxID=2071632 RepID=UPI003AF0EC0D